MTSPKIRVLIVDDSAVVRQVLTAFLGHCQEIDVIGAASDPIFAMAKMNQDWPDVIVLDVEMPRMDGITFLKKIMSVRPTPVVICSTLTEKGAETTMQALAAGAVGIVTKPKAGLKSFLEDDSGDIVHAIKAAALTDMRRMKAMTMASHAAAVKSHHQPSQPTSAPSALAATTDRLVAIGTSTGGTQALEVVLTHLPRVSPGIVIVQHMPEKFTGAFAARLNGICQIEVKEAVSGDRVIPGRALIAPGGKHMTVIRSGAQYIAEVQDGPLVNRHRPSVDVLFRSVAKYAGKNALGIIMTGMGDDGARGLRDMLAAGARTAGQDEKTCVVYGMPKEAVKLGAVQQELPLESIAGLIEQYGKAN
ncbi:MULTISPECIES: chemotaxis response regulator protein-glutamate methylesterase [unclassified Methylomonas]|uniref:protein-glutamate methylesterase/protein-glutamine glutaminase n=1 Tax=unclassified Methylomonas TaxID=2608980 RepID=UPI0008DAAD3B|nr:MULTISPECIES: chemotaxis response regulator protein-glutamate methylesterase [unclassified Methylomonas]OHX35790.1 chemotaxis response regulator protein-glutamate methylesterase [Methylomonas sp. LWB]WGS85999.1 chemotaxis response regulator protein-glutamate methylesterase [Methylomonas sp. UP202]